MEPVPSSITIQLTRRHLAPDETIVVRVFQDIGNQADGEQADLYLSADTQTITGPNTFVDTLADGAAGSGTTAGNDANETENVLADEAGDATGDVAADGTHSDVATFAVLAADVFAEKTVRLLSQDDSACVSYNTTPYDDAYVAPASLYHTPGACVEYVIAVENDGSQSATNINLTDTLPDELLFVDASLDGLLVGGTFSEPTIPGGQTSLDCDSGACPVALTNGSITGAANPGTNNPSTGAVVIRAIIK